MSLFADELPWRFDLAPGAVVLHRFALHEALALLETIAAVASQAAFRHLVTPGGLAMSVAMTNCGEKGWHSDAHGYRYTTHDPLSGKPWPVMPANLCVLAQRAAQEAGYPDFHPDACLVNRYVPGARLSLHQDKDEQDRTAPIVSVSLGLPAVFQFGGATRQSPLQRVLLEHGDVVVWGGPSRLFYHGVQPLKEGIHPDAGAVRYNLTFRKTC